MLLLLAGWRRLAEAVDLAALSVRRCRGAGGQARAVQSSCSPRGPVGREGRPRGGDNRQMHTRTGGHTRRRRSHRQKPVRGGDAWRRGSRFCKCHPLPAADDRRFVHVASCVVMLCGDAFGLSAVSGSPDARCTPARNKIFYPVTPSKTSGEMEGRRTAGRCWMIRSRRPGRVASSLRLWKYYPAEIPGGIPGGKESPLHKSTTKQIATTYLKPF